MYHFIEKLHTLYGLLQDEQSKEIFKARFAIDMEPSIPNIERLMSLGSCQFRCMEELKKLSQDHKKIILYGTAYTGQSVARMLEFKHIDFHGFCGRGVEKFPNGLLGKPVLSPEELVANGHEYYVVPAVVMKKSYREITKFLQDHNYPEDHVLDWIDHDSFLDVRQYFDFPELYRRNTAFIDGGCYDCGTSYRFAEWCEGAYSSIIAFEPDPNNYAKCCKRVQDAPLPNIQLINAGLSSQEGTAVLDVQNTMGSHIISDGTHTMFDVNPTKVGSSDTIS